MADRQLPGLRPLYFTADVSILLPTFFRRLISEASATMARSSPNFAACSVVTVIYKIQSEIWGSLPKKFGGPKTSKF